MLAAPPVLCVPNQEGGAQQDEGKAEGDEAWTPKLAAQLGQSGGVSERTG